MMDLTRFLPALKEYYTDDRVMNIGYKDHTLLAMLAKNEEFYGKLLPIPTIYANPAGRSATFTKAQNKAVTSGSSLAEFILRRHHDYGLIQIDNETMEASENDKGAFIEARITEINGIIAAMGQSLGSAVYRDGTGAIGQVSAEPAENVGSFTIVLTQPDEITNYSVDQDVVIWSAKTAGTQKISATGVSIFTISKINRNTGAITFSTTYDATGTIAANDFLFIDGDRGNKVTGVDGWIPATDPDATLFLGVDRSVDVTRLGGLRIDGTGMSTEEALVSGLTLANREGAKIDYFFMNYLDWRNLELELGSKVVYVNVSGPAQISFRGIQIASPKGVVTVLADQDCIPGVAFGLQMDMWKLYSLKKAIRLLNADGLEALRVNNADALEIRYGYYAELGCRAPGFNVRVKLR